MFIVFGRFLKQHLQVEGLHDTIDIFVFQIRISIEVGIQMQQNIYP